MLYRCISQIQRAGNIAALYYCLGRFLEVSKQFRFLGGYECQLADSPFDDDCPLDSLGNRQRLGTGVCRIVPRITSACLMLAMSSKRVRCIKSPNVEAFVTSISARRKRMGSNCWFDLPSACPVAIVAPFGAGLAACENQDLENMTSRFST